VFQTFNLLARSDVLHNVELPLIYGGVSSSERKKMAREAIGRVGLTERIHHKPNELSGWTATESRYRRELLSRSHRFLLADEPTGKPG